MSYINNLKDNQIFVFGSNEAGIHGAGAAKQAFKEFGARWGQGIGIAGRTYAIPTKDIKIQTLPLSSIKKYVDVFLDFAERNLEWEFLVTAIGCGLAGYKPEQIAPMFKNVPSNVILPKEFICV